MQLAPAIKHFAGYDDVRAAGFGPIGMKVPKVASSGGHEILRCDVDLFDAERDTFPYPGECFEFVLAGELLEHLKVDPMHMLFEIYRVLERDGRVLISTPNCASIASLEQALWRSANPYTYSLYPNPQRPGHDGVASHIREYTPDELRKLWSPGDFRSRF
jgi:ubiquinone/menaquinone biosynthesis C-methylase UbiE